MMKSRFLYSSYSMLNLTALSVISSVILSVILTAMLPGTLQAQQRPDTQGAFSKPTRVNIINLPQNKGQPLSTEEPFVSRDGLFLFFNSAKSEGNKDLHYARFIENQWIYQGEIGAQVNNEDDVQGNPTMDRNYRFYWIDSGTPAMVKGATFNAADGVLNSIHTLEQIPKRKVRLFAQQVQGNMGVEVTSDGSQLYFSRAIWDMNFISIGLIKGSDILMMQYRDGEYHFDRADTDILMQHINTDNLEYAASISDDGLELFYTSMSPEDIKPGRVHSRIMYSTRENIHQPWQTPAEIKAIGNNDFVEGPAISPDGRTLYYHKQENGKFSLYQVSR